MVKVIKHGKKKFVDCNFCGAQLSYSVNDIIENINYLSRRGAYTERYILCPDCEKRVMIEPFKSNSKGVVE